MKSDLPLLTPEPARVKSARHEGLGYPFRLMVALAAVLALSVTWLVAQLQSGVAWMLTGAVVIVAALLMLRRTTQQSIARDQCSQVFAGLGEATADIPVGLRTRMPLVLVIGDDLPALFNRNGQERFVHVGDGAIWLRIDRPQDVARLAPVVRQWRDGRAPDAVMLSVVPGRYADADALTQSLRLARQAVADAARRLGSRPLPGYVAVYQRLTAAPAHLSIPHWYGVSSTTHVIDAQRIEAVICAAEDEVGRTAEDALATATRAAALASVTGWTQRVVFHALTDRQQPAQPWALFGAGWIDCGPQGGAGNPWERDVQMWTCVDRATPNASPRPWPLPQPLIQAMPQRFWMSPRIAAFAHVVGLLACALAVAFFFSARHNQTLLARIGADLGRYSMVRPDHDVARHDALKVLVADRDELERYARTGVPLPLSFGLYRGARLIAPLDAAIASYQPPPPPPQIVTLDSMSLFDSGKAQLKAGSTRVMVNALEMIKAHPDKRILVAGYTDNVGDPDSNLQLSTARAEAVRDWLIEASGIPGTQFAIQGYGDTRPIASNDTDEGRARNRRVEITLVPDAPDAHQAAR